MRDLLVGIVTAREHIRSRLSLLLAGAGMPLHESFSSLDDVPGISSELRPRLFIVDREMLPEGGAVSPLPFEIDSFILYCDGAGITWTGNGDSPGGPAIITDDTGPAEMLTIAALTLRLSSLEERRRADEEKYRALFDNHIDAVYINDLNGNFLDANQAALDLLGYAPDEITGLNFASILPPDQIGFAFDSLKQVHEKGRLDTLAETRVLCRDGREIWIEYSAALVMKEGRPAAAMGVARDITDRKRAELLLRESEERLRLVTDHMKDMVAQVDTSGRFLFISPSHCSALGYERDELIGKEFLSMIHPDDRGGVLEAFRNGIERPSDLLIEYRFLRKDGAYIWLEATGDIIRDEKGRVTGLVGISRDITRRREMEQALQKSRETYRLIAENMTDLICRTDDRGVLAYVSPSSRQILGMEPEELLGRPILDLVHADDRSQASRAVDRGLAAKSRGRIDSRMLRKDGTFVWMETAGRFVFDEVGRIDGAVFVSRDITERKTVQEEIRRNESYLRILADSMIDLILHTDTKGTILYASKSIAGILGFNPEDAVGTNLFEMAHDDDRKRLSEAVKRAVGARSGSRSEFRCRRAGGGHIWMELRGKMTFGETETVTGIVFVGRDVTARKELEESLRLSEERYRTIVDYVQEGICIVTTDGRIVYLNSRMAGMFGFGMEEMLGTSLLDYRYKDDESLFLKFLGKRKSDQAAGGEVRFRRKDKTELWVIINYNPLSDKLGKATGTLVILFDITERRRSETQIKQDNLFRNAVINSASEGMCVGHITAERPYLRFYLWNRRMREITGYDMDQVNNRGWFELLFPDMGLRKRARDRGSLVMQGSDLNGEEWIISRLDGEKRNVLISTVSLDMGREEGSVLAMMQDVTSMKNVETRLLASLSEKELLLKEIHHRVKNNFQIISSLLNLQRSGTEDNRIALAFDDIQNRIRAMGLIHEKLYQSADIAHIDFGSYMRTLAGDLYHNYAVGRKAIRMQFDTEKINLTVEQAIPCGLILNELVTNALKYAFPDDSSPDPEIRFLLKGKGKYIIFGLEDNGVGLPDSVVPGSTSSLGLSIVPLLAGQLKGEWEVNRRGGTSFLVRFPRAL